MNKKLLTLTLSILISVFGSTIFSAPPEAAKKPNCQLCGKLIALKVYYSELLNRKLSDLFSARAMNKSYEDKIHAPTEKERQLLAISAGCTESTEEVESALRYATDAFKSLNVKNKKGIYPIKQIPPMPEVAAWRDTVEQLKAQQKSK